MKRQSPSIFRRRNCTIEDIDNPELSRKIKELSEEDIRLITLLVYEKYTQKEVAELLGITQGAVSMRYTKLKKMENSAYANLAVATLII